ncbi:MAG: hypothetical protein HKM95_03385 [Inquilinus sp.]|nr:hypothetical protein [Inquilinus sp.]
MAWPKQGSFGFKGLGVDRTTRHTVLFIVGIANIATLIFALERVVEEVDGAYVTIAPDMAFYGLLALSVILSVVSYFLPQYQDKETRFGARAMACGLPIAVVAIMLNKVL